MDSCEEVLMARMLELDQDIANIKKEMLEEEDGGADDLDLDE